MYRFPTLVHKLQNSVFKFEEIVNRFKFAIEGSFTTNLV